MNKQFCSRIEAVSRLHLRLVDNISSNFGTQADKGARSCDDALSALEKFPELKSDVEVTVLF